jgi:hypothetical protein
MYNNVFQKVQYQVLQVFFMCHIISKNCCRNDDHYVDDIEPASALADHPVHPLPLPRPHRPGHHCPAPSPAGHAPRPQGAHHPHHLA